MIITTQAFAKTTTTHRRAVAAILATYDAATRDEMAAGADWYGQA